MVSFDFAALSAIAQLGLGLAGFSGIGLVLTRSAGRLQRFELYRLGIMLGTAVGAMFLPLLPIALSQFGMQGEDLCRLSAAVMSVHAAAYATYYHLAIRYLRRTVPEVVGPITVRVVLTLHIINCLVQGASASGWIEHCVGFYWLGLFWLLAHATWQFWRILFIRPRDADAS